MMEKFVAIKFTFMATLLWFRNVLRRLSYFKSLIQVGGPARVQVLLLGS